MNRKNEKPQDRPQPCSVLGGDLQHQFPPLTPKDGVFDKGGEALHRLCREVGDAPPLHTPKVRLDGAVSTDGAVGIPVHCRGLDQMAFKGPFHLKPPSELCGAGDGSHQLPQITQHRFLWFHPKNQQFQTRFF